MSTTPELLELQIDGSQVMVGVFGTPEEAARAREMLVADGFDPQAINVVSRSQAEAGEVVPALSPADNPTLAEPVAPESRLNIGTGIGLVTGAAGGVAVGLALLEAPGLSSLLTSQAVAAGIFGVVGAILGAWGGSVAGNGPGEEDLSYFTDELGSGAYLVAVRTNRIDDALDVLRDAGARNMRDYDEQH